MKKFLQFGQVIAFIYMIYVGYYLIFKTTENGLLPRSVTIALGVIILLLMISAFIAKIFLVLKNNKKV